MPIEQTSYLIKQGASIHNYIPIISSFRTFFNIKYYSNQPIRNFLHKVISKCQHKNGIYYTVL